MLRMCFKFVLIIIKMKSHCKVNISDSYAWKQFSKNVFLKLIGNF